VKNSVCPECREPVGLGTYFGQMWMTRIDCPSCKQTVKVDGMGPYYLVTVPPAVVLGAMSRTIRLEYGIEAVVGIGAVFLLIVTALFLVGLSTWIKLVRDQPER
jgi:hypothetical protein